MFTFERIQSQAQLMMDRNESVTHSTSNVQFDSISGATLVKLIESVCVNQEYRFSLLSYKLRTKRKVRREELTGCATKFEPIGPVEQIESGPVDIGRPKKSSTKIDCVLITPLFCHFFVFSLFSKLLFRDPESINWRLSSDFELEVDSKHGKCSNFCFHFFSLFLCLF